ncbi:MAG: bZIP transcription factor [Lentisphaerota bacterium]
MIQTIADIIAGLPLNVVLRKQLEILGESAAALEQRIETLEKENSTLVEANAKLTKEILSMKKHEEFVEHCGALFKRNSGAGYQLVVYCPRCKTSTGAGSSNMAFFCIPCKWYSRFKVRDLSEVMSTLPK